MKTFIVLAGIVAAVRASPFSARPEVKRAESIEPECISDNSCILVGDMYIANPDAIGGLSSVVQRAWPDGVMPYTIAPAFQNIPSVKATIEKAIATLNAHTCITLRPKQAGDTNWVTYQPEPNGRNTCNSLLGFAGGNQAINLGDGTTSSYCLKSNAGTIMHETIHAMGFVHEQMRDDRDDFVKINWENLVEGVEKNYWKTKDFFNEEFSAYNEPYDYESIMHYSPLQGAKSWEEQTMTAVQGSGAVGDPANMGQRDYLTQSDVDGINAKYQGVSGCAKVRPLP